MGVGVNVKIALLSYGDIHNYGDEFFSYVFSRELLKRIPNAHIDIVTNIVTVLYGGVSTIAYSREEISKYDAVILVCGETIHDLDEAVWNAIYEKLSHGEYKGTPSNIVFDWADEKMPFKAWFAVGVLPVQQRCWSKIINCLHKLDYISVRGILSKKMIENAHMANNPNLDIVPDIGWLFPTYIDTSEKVYNSIREKYDLKNAFIEPYVVVQMHDSSLAPTQKVAQMLDIHYKKTGIPIYLLPIIAPWNDYETMMSIHELAGEGVTILPNNLSIMEIGAILCGCSYFCGSSMHGAITVMAVGKPASNIHTWYATKLQDLHGMMYTPKHFINNWECFGDTLMNLHNNKELLERQCLAYGDYARLILEQKIDEFCEILEKGVNKK